MLTNLSQVAARARLNSRWIPVSIAASLVALPVATIEMNTADAKTPGSTYCFYGTCHRVKTIAEMQSLVGTQSSMKASFYDGCKVDRYNPCGLTSSGEMFHPDRTDNAASPIYPDGTKLLVWSRETKEAAVLRVNNAGPYWGPRTLDVSRAAAERLGFKHKGVGELDVRVLSAPEPHESRYIHEREYEPVPGHIGQFENLDEAEKSARSLMEVQSVTTAVLAPLSGYRPSPMRTAPRNDLADPANGSAALVASASGPRTRTRLVSVAQKPKADAILTAAAEVIAPVKIAMNLLAETATLANNKQPARASLKQMRRSVASRQTSAKKPTVATRSAPRASKMQVAAHGDPVDRKSAHDIISAGFNGPMTLGKPTATRSVAAAYGSQGKSAAWKQAMRTEGASSQGRSGKKLSGLQGKARLKVSDARDAIMPVMLPLNGGRMRLPVDINGQKPVRVRGVSGSLLA